MFKKCFLAVITAIYLSVFKYDVKETFATKSAEVKNVSKSDQT